MKPELLEIRDLHQDYRTVNERYPLETRLSDHDVRLLREHKDGICSNDVLCITFTSGTSAVPKAVMLTQKNVISDVKLFAEHVGENVRIKAAGGVASFDDAEKFIELGASRLGTSRIVKLAKNEAASGY